MVSTSGSQLLPKEAVRGLRDHLFPLTTILTPNVPEALLLLSDAGLPAEAPGNVKDLIKVAKAVQSLGPKFVLLKGGHLPLQKDGNAAKTAAERVLMVDILYGNGTITRIESAYQSSKNTHGTGCSLACKFELPGWRRHSSDGFSRHSIESCKWTWYRPSSEACL
jgi:hydroxymethylpyrimidine kinase/phosphomethylpyrimidine kinase